LIHIDFAKPFVLEIDISNFALGVVLSQLGENNLLHPISFCFCKFFPVEINYEIYHKEFLTIVDGFNESCHLFERVQHETIMYSNHKLQYFMTIRVLN
jgi:hypothetical protein